MGVFNVRCAECHDLFTWFDDDSHRCHECKVRGQHRRFWQQIVFVLDMEKRVEEFDHDFADH